MRLYNDECQRLYINSSERRRLLKIAETLPADKKAFLLTLVYTGCRLSEARYLTHNSLQAEEGILAIRTLKRRKFHMREIPIPPQLISALQDHHSRKGGINASSKTKNASHAAHNNLSQNNSLIWQNEAGEPIDRATAYRWIKEIMNEANIHGAQATPKGLRHGFGIHAVLSNVPLSTLQKWMGHADIRTTAIYANVVGKEEKEMAGRMW